MFGEVCGAGTGPGRSTVRRHARRLALLADGDGLADALRLIAAPAVLTPALVRARAGEPAIPPDPALGHAADILRMLRGSAGARPAPRRSTPIW